MFFSLNNFKTNLTDWDQESDNEAFPPPPLGYSADSEVQIGEDTMFWANYTNLSTGYALIPEKILTIESNGSWGQNGIVSRSVFAIDADGDGYTEILTTGFDGSSPDAASLYVWNLSGDVVSKEANISWDIGTTYSYGIHAADVDADGDVENGSNITNGEN